jgi:hypothetical protein
VSLPGLTSYLLFCEEVINLEESEKISTKDRASLKESIKPNERAQSLSLVRARMRKPPEVITLSPSFSLPNIFFYSLNIY